jgi:hypothetical protein
MRRLLKIRQTGPCWGVMPYSEELEFKHTRMQSRAKKRTILHCGMVKGHGKKFV